MQYRKLSKKTQVTGKRVLVRVAANVPIINGRVDRDGAYRLERLQSTISFLVQKKAKVILVGHLGKPRGKRVGSLTMAPVAKRLSSILQKDIIFIPQTIGSKVDKAIAGMKGGDIIFLENVRFFQEELLNRASFARKLASLADIYVNEAFAVSHRKHASIASVPLHIPAYAGFQFQDEIKTLSKVKNNPKKPLAVIIGGRKIESKLGVISGFARKAHIIFLGGDTVNPLIDPRRKKVLNAKQRRAVRTVERLIAGRSSIMLPEDVIVTNGKRARTIPTSQIGGKDTIIDVGGTSIARLLSVLKSTNTIIWSGPLGMFEHVSGKKASVTLARFLARTHISTIVGGGETTELILKLRLQKQFSFLSTGGGAMLVFLSGDDLPGLNALRN